MSHETVIHFPVSRERAGDPSEDQKLDAMTTELRAIAAREESLRREIDELLLRQKHEKGMTVLVVTHDVHGARRVGDQFAVLHKGNLIAHGTASEVENCGDETARKLISEDYPA